MNKLAILLFAVITVSIGCKSRKEEKKEIEEKEIEIEIAVTPRNTSLNMANAYNNLFLDTTAVEKFIVEQQLNDTIADRLRSFYNARNFQYAWFDSNGLNEQAYGFRSLYDYSVDTSENNKSLEYRLNALMTDPPDSGITATNANIIKTELQLSQRFITYFKDAYKDSDTWVQQMEQFVPSQKQEVLKLAEAVLADKSRGNRKFTAAHGAYGSLIEPLKIYTDLAKKGGWDSIPVDKKKYRAGDSTPVIAAVKRRLQITGDLTDKDTSGAFTDALGNALKSFEATHGHTPRGIITDSLLKEMNVPAIRLVQTLLINMERMRWMPEEPEGRLILVNIPEFMMHVWNGKKKEFDMAVVVGKEGKSTTMFSGNLNQVVFSPYWNLPRSIVREEVMKSMSRNSNYLQQRHMEIIGQQSGVPVIRQLPGKDNPLGRVKFLFPNNFNIYFHDTNQKDLFKRDQRAYSHGCIRLSDPVKLANYLLSDEAQWTSEKIENAMNSGKEKYVRVKNPVPVLITYYTAWVDEDGHLHFIKDIYYHDSSMMAKMFSDAKQ
ncbi:murein L,D-transpeptidase [Chitinophaga sp. CF118]|uniref:L,D-transpeptidase family protein n=1 Tax=Chitinophaga sp. CF118 TaxID=1884367 RepID=UPI000B7C7104|nr:L,D-transpeptidase family protein [Chitinophaga sp. CF118]